MIALSNNNYWIIEQAKHFKNCVAVISDSINLKYGDLLKSAEQSANYFYEIGIRKQDHIAIVSENNIDFVITILGLWLIGAIPIPINIKLNKKEIKNLIDHSQSKFLVNVHGLLDIINDSSLQIIEFKSEFCINHNKLHFENQFNSNEIALMIYTSGSTGKAKCVELTFNNLFESAKSADSFINHNTSDAWLASLPFYHIGGFSIITRSIIAGCKIIIPSSLKEDDLYKAIQNYTPTMLSLVPSMLVKMIKNISAPWAGLRNIFIGGGPVTASLVKLALEKSWPISVVYGSTETASMVTISSTENLAKNGLSAGMPLANVVVKINKEKSINLNSEEFGNIIVSAKSIAQSYFNLNNDDDQQLVDGKYLSNDLGKIDANGNLHIIGRKDDVVISGGENISLAEIERALNDYGRFGYCIAMGVIDEKWGQSYIVITESHIENVANAIKDFLNEQFAKFKLPQKIFQVKEIPKSQLGKVKKNELKKLIKADFL